MEKSSVANLLASSYVKLCRRICRYGTSWLEGIVILSSTSISPLYLLAPLGMLRYSKFSFSAGGLNLEFSEYAQISMDAPKIIISITAASILINLRLTCSISKFWI